jgi:hypothetical protein
VEQKPSDLVADLLHLFLVTVVPLQRENYNLVSMLDALEKHSGDLLYSYQQRPMRRAGVGLLDFRRGAGVVLS